MKKQTKRSRRNSLKKRNPQKRPVKKTNFKKKLRKNIQNILLKHLCWPKSIAKFTACMVCALLSVTGVWHKKIAQTIDGDSLVESTERRIQRFFCNFVIYYHGFSVMLYQLLEIKGRVTVILDRTNWDYGKSHINIFVAAALYQRIGIHQSFAVPLVWEVFDKKGGTNTIERKHLMHRLFRVLGKENIEVVLADREFIGDKWLNFLYAHGIPFIVRIKKMMFVEYQGKHVNALALVALVKYKEKLKFNVALNGIPVQLSATRSIDGELVIVVASMNITYDPLDQYLLRWMIELFFKSIKTKGFNIEETHMTEPSRIKKLFAVAAFASICAVVAGAIRYQFKKISIKNHGRPEFSLFTYGLDFLRAIFRGVNPFRMLKTTNGELLLTHHKFRPPSFFIVGEKRVFALFEG